MVAETQTLKRKAGKKRTSLRLALVAVLVGLGWVRAALLALILAMHWPFEFGNGLPAFSLPAYL